MPPETTTRYDRICTVLTQTFRPLLLEIVDESAKHAGHAERLGQTDGETHFKITMIAAALSSMTRVERSRAVHAALDGELKSGLHALSLTLKSPDETRA